MIEAEVPAEVDAVEEELNGFLVVQQPPACAKEPMLIVSLEEVEQQWKRRVGIVQKVGKLI